MAIDTHPYRTIDEGYRVPSTKPGSGNGVNTVRRYRQFVAKGGDADYETHVTLQTKNTSATVGGKTVAHHKDEPETYKVEGSLGKGEEEVEIEFARGEDEDNPEPVQIGFVDFISIKPKEGEVYINETWKQFSNFALESDGFSFDTDDGNHFRGQNVEGGSAEGNEPNTIKIYDDFDGTELTAELEINNGLSFTIQRNSYPSDRIRLIYSEPLENAKSLLKVSSAFVESSEDFATRGESGYWGVWIITVKDTEDPSKGNYCLWIDLTDGESIDDPVLPEKDRFDNEDYDYIKLGPGEQEIDLSQFEESFYENIELQFEAAMVTVFN